MSERIVLACASDAGYAPHASVMLTSAITHTPDARFLACFLHPEGFPEQTRWLVEQAGFAGVEAVLMTGVSVVLYQASR